MCESITMSKSSVGTSNHVSKNPKFQIIVSMFIWIHNVEFNIHIVPHMYRLKYLHGKNTFTLVT